MEWWSGGVVEAQSAGLLEAFAKPADRLTNRGGKGVINMKTTKKTGRVVGVHSVKEDSELMIVSQNGKMIRIESSTIRQVGRSSQGVKLVSLDEDDKVAAASVLPDVVEPNGDAQETLPIQ